MDTPTPAYSHTQKAALCLLVYATAALLFIGAWQTQDQLGLAIALAGAGTLTAVLALAFHHLTVVDVGEGLTFRFGPLPLFRRTIRYDDVESVEVGRTLLLEGWGIHYSIRGGWVWNLWGRDCVVHLKNGGLVRIGTDDAPNLACFLEGKVAQQGT